MTFDRQIQALDYATKFILRMPVGCVWALSCTDDDDNESPATLNIFAEEEQWPELQEKLKLGRPTDKGKHFASYRHGILHVSLIEEEE